MKRINLIIMVLGTALALAPAASAVVLSDGGGGTGGTAVVPSTQPTNDATQALVARSEGLAKYYGTDPATQAVLLRSTGLANYYGLDGVTIRPDILGGNGGSEVTPISTGNSYDWNTTIGASLAALLLVAMAATVITRRRHQLSF
ncbi:MAG TPA: hypothetical protein VF232_11540 [Gaiellaceae bacterium]